MSGRLRPLFLMVAVLLFAGLACNLNPEEEVVESGLVGPTNSDLAQVTVQILALQTSGSGFEPMWSGSGTVISKDGLILTNAHVVSAGPDFEPDAIGIAVTTRTDEPPTSRYLARVAAVDFNLDLAVVKIETDIDGNPVAPELPYIMVGDSDNVEIGDQLRILGYPGIGGETITFTEGAVSGFINERGVDGRAWIKTDATIAGGNSGGLGVNENGELIGIPTIVSSGSEAGETVDCRPLADTNRDGVLDDLDTCVPVGGFINALRPINLARALITAAESGQTYSVGSQPDFSNTGDVDLSGTFFSNLEFSNGVTADDKPLNFWYALPSGVTDLCVFWDYRGMTDGMNWGVYWFFEGTYLEDGSLPGETWQGSSEGNWWACVFDTVNLEQGLYEVSLEVEGEVLASDSVFVGGERNLVHFNLVNDAQEAICYIWLSPTLAQNWGMDELGSDEILFSGMERDIPVASGQYDLLLRDCDGNVLAEQYEIDIFGDQQYFYSGR